jgi:hypothetical protein
MYLGSGTGIFNIINLIGLCQSTRFLTIEDLKNGDSIDVPEAIG